MGHGRGIPRMVAVLSALVACGGGGGPTNTSEFAVTGVAEIQGVITDSLGVELDSVSINLGSASNDAVLRAAVVTTSSTGAYLVPVERLFGKGDSVLVQLYVSSQRSRHRGADGTTAAVTRRLWVPLAIPPAAAKRTVFNAALAVQR